MALTFATEWVSIGLYANPNSSMQQFPKVDTLIEESIAMAQVVSIYEAVKVNIAEVCAILVDQESQVHVVNDCAVPNNNAPPNVELPACTLAGFKLLE